MKMNATHCGLGLVLGILGITVSCGGTDDTGNNNPSGGASATPSAGNSSGGSSTAGSSSSTAGSSTAGSSSNNNGGDSQGNQGGNDFGNNGGNGNGFGFGGSGFFNNGGAGNDPDCPETKPDSNTECVSSGQGQDRLQCAYADSGCFCAQNDRWFCIGGGGENCPETKPANGTDCPEQGTVCLYGNDGGCACNDVWNCR